MQFDPLSKLSETHLLTVSVFVEYDFGNELDLVAERRGEDTLVQWTVPLKEGFFQVTTLEVIDGNWLCTYFLLARFDLVDGDTFVSSSF